MKPKVLILVSVFLLIAGGAFYAAYNYRLHETSGVPAEPGPMALSGPSGGATPPASPAPSVTPTPSPSTHAFLPAAPGNAALRGHFRQMTEKALEILPRQSETRALTDEEAHFLPRKVLAQSEILIQIGDDVREHPELTDQALSFYDRCAADAILIKSIRGRCLSHLKSLASQSGRSVDMGKYPPEIRKIAEFMP